jgi:arylsulfatase A-like enzyme
VTEQISAFWDIMPTLAEITGVDTPAGIDGESFASVLRGEPAHDRARPLYWEYHAFGAMQGVRMGQWKGVRLQAREHPDGPIALFDLSTDPAETTDVASAHPDIVARIDSVMHARTLAAVGRWNFGPDYDADWSP